MSDLYFPALPGIQYPIGREIITETNQARTVSGRVFRSTYWSYPRWRLILNYEFLRSRSSAQEFQALAGLFMQMLGQWDTFLFSDPFESQVNNFQFGLGDGVTVQFAVTRPLGPFAEPVGYCVPSQVTINGVATTAYTLLENRVLQFATPPASGAALRWTGPYAYRCTFEDATLSSEEFMHQFFSSKSVKLITEKR